MNHTNEGIISSGTRLSGRRILITGAASGMGKAIAELFCVEGARLALLDVQVDLLAQVAEATCGTPLPADIASESNVATAVERAAAVMGGIDGIVNAAGILRALPIEQTTPDVWHKVHDVNLFGPYLLCNEALPHLRRSESATIVNIASMGGINTPPYMACYAASKAGLIALTKGQASEWAPTIRVNAIAPGVIRTPMTDALGGSRSGKPAGFESSEDAPPSVALGRKGTALEVAQLALFLTCRESSFVTGSVYEINGGTAIPHRLRST